MPRPVSRSGSRRLFQTPSRVLLLSSISSRISALNVSALACSFWCFSRTTQPSGLWQHLLPRVAGTLRCPLRLLTPSSGCLAAADTGGQQESAGRYTLLDRQSQASRRRPLTDRETEARDAWWGFYSHPASQHSRGQAHLVPTSLSSDMCDSVLGEMPPVTDIPPGLPTPQRAAARELPLPT